MIGIIGAMPEEVVGLDHLMTDKTVSVRAGKEFHKGVIYGKEVVVVQCGVGKVHAAVCAQVMIDHFEAEVLINTGVAGSLNNDIGIFDIVVSRRVIQHDFTCKASGGYENGEIPGIRIRDFQADARLVDIAKKSIQDAKLHMKMFEGTVLTGDQFIADPDQKAYLISEFEGDCCEMEGGAVAQVAYLNQVPFVVIRAISDKADGGAPVSIDRFATRAASHSIALLKSMILKL